MRLIMISIIILFNALGASSQEKGRDKEIQRFFKFSSSKLDVQNSFKDSIAFYTCNITITVDSVNNFKPVISSTDSKVSDQIKNLEMLKSYDYSKLRGENKRVKFILPISIVILDARYGEKYIDAHYIWRKMGTLFHFSNKEDDGYKLIYLDPVNIMVDKKVYN
jgi:hypothetical protein